MGRRKRVHDAPQSPMERLFNAGMLTDPQARELKQRRDAIHPAMLTREIVRLQDKLTDLAKVKTDDLVMKVEEAKERRLKKQQGEVKGLAL